MRALPIITDPVFAKPVQYTRYERFWLKYINDERDLPFIHMLTGIHLLVIPIAVILFTPLLSGGAWWLLYIPYFYISQLYYKGRFGLMLHCISHRKLFKKSYTWLYNYVIWVVCPFFGHTPETYFVHHMGMHHVENNHDEDASSTMRYQRDSLLGFLKYVGRFVTFGLVDTFSYFFARKRKKFYMRLTFGEVSYYLACIGLWFVNWQATLLIFLLPLFFARIVMMIGNWSQHAFIDPNNPEENTINCINTKYNHTCWNDGYHEVHHHRPALHYTEIPNEFMKHTNRYAEEKILVFDGIHYLHIFLWLMGKRYDKLADHLVNINGMYPSKEAAIELLKSRTQRFTN